MLMLIHWGILRNGLNSASNSMVLIKFHLLAVLITLGIMKMGGTIFVSIFTFWRLYLTENH